MRIQAATLLHRIGFLALLLLPMTVSRADTGDVIDDFLAGGTGVHFCEGVNVGAVWADIDDDGTYDTQVVFTTQPGSGGDAGEAQVFSDPPDGKVYFFSFIDAHCGGSAPYTGRGRFTIHFVDILATGFVWDDPSSWEYKAVQGVSLRTRHDGCYAYSDPRFDDPSYHPYLQVQAYEERFQTDSVDPHDEVVVAGWKNYQFGNAAGIKEIYINTDFCENVLDNLVLHESHLFSSSPTPGRAGLALLFDTSGSMDWSHDGSPGVPDDEKRLTLAKDAASPFLEILGDYAEGNADFSIVRFPQQPWPSGCTGEVIETMTEVDEVSIDDAVATTIPNLTAEGSTPLLSGLTSALGTFTDSHDSRAVVLLSDGYHNCPSEVAADSAEVTSAIANANAAGARIYTIGFGRPSDVDHPLLSSLATNTDGLFYDVTEAGFDPSVWVPSTALHAAYVEVLTGALGLDLGSDPQGRIKAGQKITREVPVCGSDRAVTFYLSWATRNSDQLKLSVLSADGQPVTAGMTAVRVHSGVTYSIVTVGQDFLSKPGKVGGSSWIIEIDGTGLKDTPAENFQYTVLMDSDLKMKAGVQQAQAFAGQPLVLEAKITASGKPVTGLTDVYALVSAPVSSQGRWLADNRVSFDELSKIPASLDDETLPGVMRKSRFLVDVRKVARPSRESPTKIQLRDDGTRGDRAAKDGVYSAVYKNTKVEGVYGFHLRATGKASGCVFQREARFDRYVRANVARQSLARVDVERLQPTRKGFDQFRVTAKPEDAMGNPVGPRQAKRISIQPEWGRTVGQLQDNLDGRYTQKVELPSKLVGPRRYRVQVGHLNAWATAVKDPSGKPGKAVPPKPLKDQYEEMKRRGSVVLRSVR